MNMSNVKLLHCLIVDDEPLARDILRQYIANLPMLQLAGECSSAIEAIGFLQMNTVDLIFLDIQMPQLTGIEFVRSLQSPPKIIFTTAYAEFALQGYELDVADYLLKPITFDRFVKAVKKVYQHTALTKPFGSTLITQEFNNNDGYLYFRVDRKMVKVQLNDICYIEGMKDYVKVITVGGVHVTKQSLSAVEAMLPSNLFIRAHKSYIVALKKIKSFTNEIIELEKTELPIGKLYKNEVLKLLGGYN
jgi:two-component system LytT family response regulator